MGISARNKLYAGLAIALFHTLAAAGPPVLQSDANASRLYDLASRRDQYQSLQGIPTADIQYGHYGRLRSINGRTGIVVPGAAQLKEGDSATALFETLKPMLMGTELDALKVRKVVNAFGSRTIFMDQWIHGLPVIDGGVNVRVSDTGEMILVSSLFVPPDVGASREPSLTAAAAIDRLQEQLLASGLQEIVIADVSQAHLAYWTNQGQEERPRLVWLLSASHLDQHRSREAVDYVVDATTGDVVYLERQALGLNRTTYQLNDPTNLNIANYPTGLTLLWNEGSPNPAYGAAYSVYTKVESPRNVWASLGMHYDTFGLVTNYIATNSSWWGRNTSGKPFLVFGNYMSGEMDAVAHEYGHGVFRPLAGTPPTLWWYDYHAMNEFYSDLSALITKFTAGASPALAQNWRITSLNIRDHSNPKSIPSGNFQDWYPNRRFWGDTSAVAYSNSTIYGHALYLMIHGGTHARAGQSDLHGPIPTFSVTATPASTIHSIFGRALLDMSATQTAMSGLNLKTATVNAANVLAGPAVATQVNNAWVAVGIGYGCSAPPPTPNPVISPWYCRGTHDISWTQNPGDKYHGMVANPAGVWDLVGNTNIDIASGSCQTEVPGTLKFRMRACNACGCSNWTSDYYMYYYDPCL